MGEFREFLNKQLQDPEFRKEWDALEEEHADKQKQIIDVEDIYSVAELRYLISPVLRHYGVRKAVLFGSYAKGIATEKSDVDLLVDCDLRGLQFFGLQYDIGCALGKNVDLFNVTHIEKDSPIEQEIRRTGIDIFDGSDEDPKDPFNDLFYVCSLIEYVGRMSFNRRKTVVEAMGINGLRNHLETACVDHCLSFCQVCDEVMERFGIQNGTYGHKRELPSHIAVGKAYARLIAALEPDSTQYAQMIYAVFTSGFPEAVGDFDSPWLHESRVNLRKYYQS